MPSGKKVKSLKNKYSSFFTNGRDIPEPANSVEGICPTLREFKDNQVEQVIEVLLKDREGNLID